jgi:hypothetical protein
VAVPSRRPDPRSIYFIFGAIGIVLSIVWYVATRTHPSEHPGIAPEELEEITAELRDEPGASVSFRSLGRYSTNKHHTGWRKRCNLQ